ncbi:MAG TPA: hypothetical protein VM223_04590, partial [Planctomycetota bacterium]|nr:hypothetical protein [Planctomycetota bacterium]
EKKDQGTGNKEQGTRRPPCVANARNTNEALEAQHVVATGVNRIARMMNDECGQPVRAAGACSR